MPTFFPASLGLLADTTVAPSADSFRQLMADLWVKFQERHGLPLLYVLLGQLVLIVCYWLASKPLTEWRSTFGQAVKVWLLYILSTVLVVAILIASAIMIPIAFHTWHAAHRTGPGVTIIGFSILSVVALLLSLWFLFLIPMRVYRIGFLSALVFVLLSGALSWAGRMGLSLALSHPMHPSEEVAARWMASLVGGDYPKALPGEPLAAGPESEYVAAERRAADRTKTQTERLAALKEIYDRLETDRKALPAGDTAALTAWEHRKARYEQLLNDLRAEVAAHRGSAI